MGSVTPRPDGRGFRVRWADLDGKRRDRYAPTEQEGLAILRQELAARDAGVVVVSRRHTVATWMTTWWPTHQPRLRPRSADAYSRVVDTWAASAMGGVRLVDLRPVNVERQLADWSREGVSPRTLRLRMTILRMALESAVRSGFAPTNPAKVAAMPALPDARYMPLPVAELVALRAAIVGHELEPVFTLALDAGLR